MATNFPNGVLSRGVPAEGIGVFSPFGNVFYVDSGHGNANDDNPGTSPKAPMATIDAAYNRCTASQGDVVVVAGGHTETISGATDLVLDTAGVTIIGMGRGSDRPTLTFSATDSEIPISAVNVTLQNFLLTITGAIDVVVGITVSAAGVRLLDIEGREPAATSQWVDFIVGTTCDQMEIVDLKFKGLVAGDATQAAVSITGTPTEVRIINPWIVGEFVAAGIDISGVATDLYLLNPVVEQRHSTQDACITVAATATGFLIGARLRTATNDDPGITAALTASNKLQIYDLQIVNADGEFAVIGASEVTTLDTANQVWGAPSVIT